MKSFNINETAAVCEKELFTQTTAVFFVFFFSAQHR